MDGENLSFFEDDDIFSVLEAWESASISDNNNNNNNNNNPLEDYSEIGSKQHIVSFEFQKSSSGYNKCSPTNHGCFQECSETEVEGGGGRGVSSPKCKRQKVAAAAEGGGDDDFQAEELGQQRTTSHITVERKRRKQMNENLSVLRSLMPRFYVKRGDQASIIGGVVDYINELQQLIQSLEAKKQRKSYSEILSPRPVSSPRKLPLSPRLSLPVSPSTPQSRSPYKFYMHQPAGHLNPPSLPIPVEPSPCISSKSSVNDAVNELVASSKSATAEVEVKLSGPNLVLKTVSRRVPGQAVKIVSALEELDLEILHVKISTVDERVLNLFTIKIGIECQLSAEELAQQIHQTFC